MGRNIRIPCLAMANYSENYGRVSFLYAVEFFGGLCCSMISTIVIACTDREREYFLYFLLPVGFMFFLILTLFCNHKLHRKITFLIFIALYFLKLVVTPVVSAMGDWHTLAEGSGYLDYLPEAILLTVWEPIFVGVALILYTRGIRRSIGLKANYLKDFSSRFDGADLLIVVGVVFVVGTLLYYPPLRVRLEWMLCIATNQDATPVVRSWRNFFVANGREIPLGIVDTMMMKVFYVIRVLFPMMLMEKLYRTKRSWKEKAVLSFLILLMAAQITTEANGETVLCIGSLIFLALALYPEVRKRYGIFILILGVLAAGILFVLKVKDGYSSESVMKGVSATLNAYLNGPINLAIAIKSKASYNVFMGSEEILGGLPFLNRFFYGYQTSVLFNKSFWGFAGRTDQLLPALGQGYMYFGPIFAPIFQFLFIIWGVGLENISEKADSIKVKGYFIFLALIATWTIGNNFSHVMSFVQRYLPGVIVLYFKRYRIKLKS